MADALPESVRAELDDPFARLTGPLASTTRLNFEVVDSARLTSHMQRLRLTAAQLDGFDYLPGQGVMLLVASLAGLGGGNFASSMANISFFYPDRMKGWALGLNAAGGNIGVSTVQLLVPILLGFGIINLYQATPGAGGVYIQNAGLMWLLPLAVAVFCALKVTLPSIETESPDGT